MGVAIILFMIVFLASPFFGLGLFRKWIVAVPVWALLAAFTAFIWLYPLPIGADQQDQMGHDAFVIFLLTVLVGGFAGFCFGLGVSVLRARKVRSSLRESTQ